MVLVICKITLNSISICLLISELQLSGLKQNCKVESLKVELEGVKDHLLLGIILHLRKWTFNHYKNQVSQLLSGTISVTLSGSLLETFTMLSRVLLKRSRISSPLTKIGKDLIPVIHCCVFWRPCPKFRVRQWALMLWCVLSANANLSEEIRGSSFLDMVRQLGKSRGTIVYSKCLRIIPGLPSEHLIAVPLFVRGVGGGGRLWTLMLVLKLVN